MAAMAMKLYIKAKRKAKITPIITDANDLIIIGSYHPNCL